MGIIREPTVQEESARYLPNVGMARVSADAKQIGSRIEEILDGLDEYAYLLLSLL